MISVFTPSHDVQHLDDCYASLLAQTHADWEWVVLLNGRARWEPTPADPRVRVERARNGVRGVGALKRAACELTGGDVLVELDHDDVLTTDCLEHLATAFAEHPEAVLVFSDFAQIDPEGNAERTRFNQDNGWLYDDVIVDGRPQLRCQAMEPSPHNVSYIWYAPNHVRAFRRTAYDAVGGFDRSLRVLDDQDLMMRLYEIGEFVRIPRCLYLQRMHSKNTQSDPKTNVFIQQETVRRYQDGVADLAAAWAQRTGRHALALRTPTTIGQSPFSDAPGVVVTDVDPTSPALPFPDSSVAVIEAHDILQRIPDRAAFLNECYRVLCHAGMLLTMTPSTDGRGAFQDPSHVAFYNENSFDYLTQAALRAAVPSLRARFQVSHLRTFYPSPDFASRFIPYVQANLLAVKDGPRQGGPLLS